MPDGKSVEIGHQYTHYMSLALALGMQPRIIAPHFEVVAQHFGLIRTKVAGRTPAAEAYAEPTEAQMNTIKKMEAQLGNPVIFNLLNSADRSEIFSGNGLIDMRRAIDKEFRGIEPPAPPLTGPLGELWKDRFGEEIEAPPAPYGSLDRKSVV